jgi:hypothetical protein
MIDTFQWSHPTVIGDLPTPRAGVVMVPVTSNKVVLFGGSNWNTVKDFGDTWIIFYPIQSLKKLCLGFISRNKLIFDGLENLPSELKLELGVE